MSYRRVARKIVRYTEATRPTQNPTRQPADGLDSLSYRELQQRAGELDISAKQSAEALKEAIRAAQ